MSRFVEKILKEAKFKWADELVKFADQDWFIHFSNSIKFSQLKTAKKLAYLAPEGFYGFPLTTSVIKDLLKKDGKDYKEWLQRKNVFLFKIRTDGMLDPNKYTKRNLILDLKKIFGEEKFKKIKPINYSYDKPYWGLVFCLSHFKINTRDALLKLGYNSIYDEKFFTITHDLKGQLVVLNTKVIVKMKKLVNPFNR